MKNKINIIFLFLSTCIIATSCKKDHLTKEDLENSLNNIDHPTDEYANWRLVINQTYFGTTDWKDSLNNSSIDFPINSQSSNDCRIENYNFKYYWGQGKYSLFIDLDTNLLSFGNTRGSVLATGSLNPYLVEMYSKNKYLDKLEIVNVTKNEFLFYSTALGKALKYTR